MKSIPKENVYILHSIENYMAKVLISTIFSTEPILLSATKLGVDRIYLLIDKDIGKDQKKALDSINDSLGKVIEIKTIKTEVYDIVKIAEDVVKAIDLLSDKDQIFVNITGARRTQALGLLYAAYARNKLIKQIIYVIPGQNKIISLPKLDYNLTNSQKMILQEINKKKVKNLNEFSEKVELSKGMLYRTITDLQNLGFIIQEDEEGFKLTDAGRIVLL